MNWTTANISLKDNSNTTTNTKMYRSPIREGSPLYKSIETEYIYKLDCYSVPYRVFMIPLFMEGLSHYIALHGPS